MIDGGIFLGRNPANGNLLTLESLKDHGIERAIAASYKSLFFDFKEGNQEILELSKRFSNRLIPAAIINPAGFNITEDLPYLRTLKKSGFKVLGIYLQPAYYEINLESPLLHQIVQEASKSGLVIQFGLRNAGDLAKVSFFMGKIPGPVLIRWTSGRGYNFLSEIIAAAQRHLNWYFDVGSLTSLGTIPLLAKNIGAGRLFFASNFPESFAYTSHCLLQTSGLSKSDLAEVYSGTLQKLLFKTEKTSSLSASLEKKIKPWINHPKIDTHWHTDGWNLIEPQRDFKKFKPELDRFNLKKIIISAIRALNYDIEDGNRSLAELLDRDSRLYGLIVIDPTRLDASLEQMKRYLKHPKFLGLKTIQDLFGVSLNHPGYQKIFKVAEGHKIPVMAHITGMKEAAVQFPKITFVCAHATYERVKHLFHVRNVVFDAATSHNAPRETQMAAFIQAVGAKRVLFASDAPLMSPAWTLGKLMDSGCSPNDLENIFWNNALRVFPRLQNLKASHRAK